jgi:hypothetical protein
MRSITYQMTTARFPACRDLKGFDFAKAQVDEALVRELSELSFLASAHNVVFIGGPGTGKTPRLGNRNRGRTAPREACALLLNCRADQCLGGEIDR